MNGPDDWGNINRNNSLPHTCCPNAPNDGSCTKYSNNVYRSSCFEILKSAFLRYGAIIGGVGIGIACCQVRHWRSQAVLPESLRAVSLLASAKIPIESSGCYKCTLETKKTLSVYKTSQFFHE